MSLDFSSLTKGWIFNVYNTKVVVSHCYEIILLITITAPLSKKGFYTYEQAYN